MSPLAKKPCAKHGCNVLTTQRFCGDHATQPQIQRKEFDKQRSFDPLRKLYFLSTWRETRKYIIARDPLCKICSQSSSTVADHKIPAIQYCKGFDVQTEEGQRRFFDEDNLQGVCKSCHDSKTARETNFGRNYL